MKEISKLIAIREGRYDTNYTLVRLSDGQLYVETFESPNKPFQRGSAGPRIYPEDFDKHEIDGKPLREYVEAALREADNPNP